MQRDRINDQWQERWDVLQLMLEVYQFARDAAVAEQWLIAQEPYLLNEDLGETLAQVEQLIKKHETFEKSIHAQEERFNALRKLTTLELKQRRSTGQSDSVDATAAAVSPKQATDEASKKAATSNLENSRLSLYLEEFKTIDERERDAETQKQQEQLVREAEERVKREKELQQEAAQRQREKDVIDVTKALASVGASAGASTSRLQSSPQSKGSLLLLLLLLLHFKIFCL